MKTEYIFWLNIEFKKLLYEEKIILHFSMYHRHNHQKDDRRLTISLRLWRCLQNKQSTSTKITERIDNYCKKYLKKGSMSGVVLL